MHFSRTGGVLHATTDHPGYAEHIIAAVAASEDPESEARLVRADPGTDAVWA